MLTATRDLEQALASASFEREEAWRKRISQAVAALQSALRETRDSADAKESLLHELTHDFPRLQPRAERLRNEYDALQRQFVEVEEAFTRKRTDTPQEVEQIREQLARLLTKLRRIQAVETELVFEAYHVDIGVGD